jgi:hypothetical protein
VAEADAADEEAGNAYQALGPAVGLGGGLVGSAKAEEDGVARLHADERRPSVVGHAVGEARDEAAHEQQERPFFLVRLAAPYAGHKATAFARFRDRALFAHHQFPANR